MASGIVTTGISGNTYRSLLRKQVVRVRPRVFGLAVAYVSITGFNLATKIFEEGEVQRIRMVTDIRDCVTHPRALRKAMDVDWEVRVVGNTQGTFHPKLYVGGNDFHENGGISGLSLSITGSPNLSRSGLLMNGECSFWSTSSREKKTASKAWKDCWDFGRPLTARILDEYEGMFAARNRKREAKDLVSLGVADELPQKENGRPRKGVKPPPAEWKTIADNSASVAWAGLQSITGLFNLQVEYPKEAGLVLRRILEQGAIDGSVEIKCSDGVPRSFQYRYYEQNGMFRLNVPNEVPLVEWARTNRDGIAIVISDDSGGFHFEIVPPGDPFNEVVDRSLALGTWGKTRTRLYGWY